MLVTVNTTEVNKGKCCCGEKKMGGNQARYAFVLYPRGKYLVSLSLLRISVHSSAKWKGWTKWYWMFLWGL